MEAISHDPNKLKTREVKERTRQISTLIRGYRDFERSICDAEKYYARINDAVRMDGVNTKDYPREWAARAEQEAMELFSYNFSIIRGNIVDAIGGEPLFKFEFRELLGDVAASTSHSFNPNERVFLAYGVEPESKGRIRLTNQSEDTRVVVPSDADFRIGLESERAEVSSW